VLAHHYPDVPLHGDFTKLRDEPFIADADVLVGGTPCQAFSVAGLRRSLDDDRGNLSLEFVRLADAIDDLRHADGREPAIIVWENVPGVLSVKDNAFGCFLAGLAGDVTPYDPPRGKWTDAGVVDGPQRAVAWRVLDAQYFGLAQRRRRVFVVASARDGFDPAAVLLEFEGLRRDSPPRREARQDAAADAAPGAGDRRSHWDGVEHPHPTLNQSFNTGAIGYSNQELFSQRGAGLVGEASTGEISHCLNAGGMGRQDYETETLVTHALRAEGFDASEDGTGRGTPLVPVQAFYSTESRCDNFPPPDVSPPLKVGSDGGGQPPAIAFSAKDHGADATEELAPTLRAMPHAASHANGGGQMAVAFAQNSRDEVRLMGGDGQIVGALAAEPGSKQTSYVALPIQEVGKRTGVSTDDPRAGIGIGANGDPMYTLQAGAQHGVAYPLDLRNAGRDPDKMDEQNRQGLGLGDDGDPSPTISTAFVPGVAAYAFQTRIARNGRGDMGDIVNALNAESGKTGKGDAAPCVATINHGDSDASTQETDAIATLRALRDAVGTEAFAQWRSGIFDTLQSPEVLRAFLHGRGVRRAAREAGCWMDDGALSRPQDLPAGALLTLWEDGPDGRSPQGRKLAQQLARQLDQTLPVLPHQNPPTMAVRRLTPKEAERLQGFPDGYTAIPWKKKPADQCPDGPRYKALGNSMAVPVMGWIGRRIAAHLEATFRQPETSCPERTGKDGTEVNG